MRTMRFVVPAFALFAGMLVFSTVSSAKPEYSKKEKQKCTFCHTAMGKKDLNEAGKYYKAHNHSLAGYQAK